jgi:fatty acid synthase subunit alpha
MLEGTDVRIAPLRRALAVWGLTADDIGILSIHGTSTGANEKNETKIWNDIFTNIGRTQGNAVPIMAQKSLVGHAKGGSAAWQLAGLLQSVYEGTIPGNRNADNVDGMFQQHTLLMFPSKTIHTDGIKAGVMVSLASFCTLIDANDTLQSSFGFGQVGGTVLILHPRYLLGALEPSSYEAYRIRNRVRAKATYKVMSEMMITNSLVRIKDAPPYTPELEVPVLMNSMARASLDTKTNSYSFTSKLETKAQHNTANAKAVAQILADGSISGVGVDQGSFLVPNDRPTYSHDVQNSSLRCHPGTRPLSSATLLTPRSRTATRSRLLRRRSLLAGLARRPSSSPSASLRAELPLQ